MLSKIFMGVGVLIAIGLPVAGSACGGGKGKKQTDSTEAPSSEVVAQVETKTLLSQPEPKPAETEQ